MLVGCTSFKVAVKNKIGHCALEKHGEFYILYKNKKISSLRYYYFAWVSSRSFLLSLPPHGPRPGDYRVKLVDLDSNILRIYNMGEFIGGSVEDVSSSKKWAIINSFITYTNKGYALKSFYENLILLNLKSGTYRKLIDSKRLIGILKEKNNSFNISTVIFINDKILLFAFGDLWICKYDIDSNKVEPILKKKLHSGFQSKFDYGKQNGKIVYIECIGSKFYSIGIYDMKTKRDVKIYTTKNRLKSITWMPGEKGIVFCETRKPDFGSEPIMYIMDYNGKNKKRFLKKRGWLSRFFSNDDVQEVKFYKK